MNDRVDIQIRVRAATGADGLQSTHTVEAQKDGSGVWIGESTFDFAAADLSRMTPEAYGKALGQQLINPAIARALAYAGAEDGTGREIRIRLSLEASPSISHTIRWEHIYLPLGKNPWPVAISPAVTFSRYIPVEMSDSLPSSEPSFKLLIAISNPSNIPPESAIDVEQELAAFVAEFEKSQAPTRLEVTVLTGSTCISDALKARLKDLNWVLQSGYSSLRNIGDVAAHCNGIHILCHGDFKAGKSQGILYLEGEDGTLQKVADDQLRAWVSPLLRLAVFQACRTAAPAPSDQAPFVGVAAKMIEFGVPAVVAMQDFVAMDDARVFAAAFYRELMQDGLVDKAVNAGRRAIDSRGGDWSIPALFQRLKTGQLWSPDPIRENVYATRVNLGGRCGIPEGLPLTVVHVANGISYNPLEQAAGPVFSFETHARVLLKGGSSICLTGPPGSHKKEQLSRLYCLLADDFLKDSSEPAPIRLSMNDLARRSTAGEPNFDSSPASVSPFEQDIASVIDGNPVPDLLAGRKFRFLVNSEQGLGPAATKAALHALKGLVARLASSCLFIFDETNLGALRVEFSDAVVLLVRPLELADVRAFLASTNSDSDKKLRRIIDICGLGDLAAVPWLLNQMRDLVRFGHEIRSRGDVMELVADNFLSRFGGRGIPRSCATRALSCIAWSMQSTRSRSIPNTELWRTLEAARGSQDFLLSAFRDTLADSNLLVPAGEEASALTYQSVCGYFAARYLMDAPESRELLEDITASLGRLSRIRHWEYTLIMFAGLQRSVKSGEHVLQVLLAGSSLFEGDQVFLAARLFVEMRQSGDASDDSLAETPIVRQILDTLIWRSRADLPRPFEDRRRALESLSSMRHLDAIPHLIALACDCIRIPFDVLASPDSPPPTRRYDFSGIRMLAIGGLFDQPAATRTYVEKNRPALLPLLSAWENLIIHGASNEMIEILQQNNPSLSTVAAFAFAFEGDKFEKGHPLLTVFSDPKTNRETLWGITEVFAGMDAAWLRDKVILPMIKDNPKPSTRACYLIQKSTWAPPDSLQRTYLEDCLRDTYASSSALRALAAIPDENLPKRLRDLCHLLLAMDWDGAYRSEGVPKPASDDDEYAWRLQYQAIMALRDVGDSSSIELLRTQRTHLNSIFVQLSFQVGEEIYWRCSGGLTKETF